MEPKINYRYRYGDQCFTGNIDDPDVKIPLEGAKVYVMDKKLKLYKDKLPTKTEIHDNPFILGPKGQFEFYSHRIEEVCVIVLSPGLYPTKFKWSLENQKFEYVEHGYKLTEEINALYS